MCEDNEWDEKKIRIRIIIIIIIIIIIQCHYAVSRVDCSAMPCYRLTGYDRHGIHTHSMK